MKKYSHTIRRISGVVKNNKGFLLFILLMAAFRTAVADWTFVPTGSMEPSIYPNEYLLVNKLAFGPVIPLTKTRLLTFDKPKRGDVVIFDPPHKDIVFVKRVIGIPGDHIQIEDNTVVLNKKVIDVETTNIDGDTHYGLETLDKLKHKIQYDLSGIPFRGKRDFTIPENYYFMMGDNRNNSVDSRYFGLVHEDKILGKVNRIAVSFSDKRDLGDRIGTSVNAL